MLSYLVFLVLFIIVDAFFAVEEIALRTAEVAQLPPQVLAKEEVIYVGSTSGSSSSEEDDDSKGRLHSTKDGKNWDVFTGIAS